MASEAIKKMFLERMLSRQQSRRAGAAFNEMAGSPEQQIDVNVPDTTAQSLQPGDTLPQGASPFGLMNVEQQTQPATGLFQGLSEQQVPQMQAVKQMVSSGSPLLQKQGMSMLDELTQGQVNPTQRPAAIQEWEMFNNLSKEQQQSYMNMKRGNSKVVNVNGVPTLVNMNQPEGAGIDAEALTTVDEQAAGKAQVASTVKGAETAAKSRVTRLDKQINDGLVAADGMGVLNRSIELLRQGIDTGGWDNLALYAKKKFGVEGADEGELSNLMGKAVLSQLRKTFGAAFTAKEGDSLKLLEAGFGMSPAANMRILNNALAIARKAAERGKSAATQLKDDFAIKQLDAAINFKLPGSKEGGEEMTDANGKRAIVYPDGTFEEIK